MSEGLLLLAFTLAWFGLTRASRKWPWLGVALGAFFGLLAGAGAWMIINAPQSEGSPAGAIAVALGFVVAVVAGGLAVWFLCLGLHGVLFGRGADVPAHEELPTFGTNDETVFGAIAVIGIGAVLIAVSAWWLFFDRKQPGAVNTRPAVVAPAHVSPRAPPQQDPSAWKLRYDECVGHLRSPDQPGQLLPCADDLLLHWDRGGDFDGMPGGGEYPRTVGAMYVAHAQETGDYLRGRSGVRSVLARVRNRFPGDVATESLLVQLHAKMEEAVRSQAPAR